MDHDAGLGGADPATAHLHLHRGFGALYGVVAAVVLTLVLLGAGASVSRGQILLAIVTVVGGLVATTFLALVTLSMVLPELNASAAGINGRISWWKAVDVTWSEVRVDVDPEALPGTLRLDIADESVSIGEQTWLGFRDFAVLVASTPVALDRLTPAACLELSRLLQIE